jgi:hypothetical protein
MLDEFSDYYADYLDGAYDCVDRIVLNAYYCMGCSPPGFRTWWRQLKGSDDDLDNTHLMRFASRMSRRVRAFAQKQKIPVIYCQAGERKHEIAEKHLPKDTNFVGVFLVLVGRAPAPIFDIQRSKSGKITNIAKKKPYAYVNHYSFHIMDPEWGHVTIKMCSHPPFGAQIMLNGHESVARRAQREGVAFAKTGNCFTEMADARRLAQIAETSFRSDGAIGRLLKVCERWIYSSCLCFALDADEQERTNFRYAYSVFQAEYSRNLLFRKGAELDQVFNGVIDHTRTRLDVKRLRTIFGVKKRPSRTKRKKRPRLEIVVEKPVYDLTVFKVHFGLITAKLYTKGERVLRIETIIHNTRALKCGRALDKFPEIIAQLKDILNRFLNALSCIDVSFIADSQLDEWPTSSQVGRTRVGGVNVNSPRIRAVMDAIVALAVSPHGFTTNELARSVQLRTGKAENEYTQRMAAYDLKKFRGKNLLHKIGNSRRYEAIPEGLRAITALLVLREKVIKPVLAGAGKPKPGPKPKDQTLICKHYQNIQFEMRNLFQTLKIAV